MCDSGVGKRIFRLVATQVPVYLNRPTSSLIPAVGSRKYFLTTPVFPSAPIMIRAFDASYCILVGFGTRQLPHHSSSSLSTTLQLFRSLQYGDFDQSCLAKKAASSYFLVPSQWVGEWANKPSFGWTCKKAVWDGLSPKYLVFDLC